MPNFPRIFIFYIGQNPGYSIAIFSEYPVRANAGRKYAVECQETLQVIIKTKPLLSRFLSFSVSALQLQPSSCFFSIPSPRLKTDEFFDLDLSRIFFSDLLHIFSDALLAIHPFT